MSHTKARKPARRNKPQSRWPLVLVVGGLLLITAAAVAFIRPSAAKATIEVTGAPSLKADREDVNLGDVKLGRTVDVSFQLTNVGDQPLRFAKEPYIEVKEGC